MRPHICCFKEENLDILDSPERSNFASRAELGYAELFIEVTADPAHDFLSDPPLYGVTDDDRAAHDLLAHANDAATASFMNRALGQHITYVAEIFARQHRIWVFSIAIFGSRARLFRWDRVGCIVSESFDIRHQPAPLCEFLWRFSQTSDAGRGHDPTIHMASAEEEDLFRTLITEHVRLQLCIDGQELERAVSEHYRQSHVSVVNVLTQYGPANADNIHCYLVSRPVISPLLLTGRGTRGYWAVDRASRRVVFLKDTWRSRLMEGETLEDLDAAGVRNVPVLISHGDVPDYFPEDERELAGKS